VGTHHIARLIFVSLGVPFVVHAMRRRERSLAAENPKRRDCES
jgi:uncharacterized membrane protein AbrB (regulator of aidB expression)